eukprot:186650-Chlamydomonas_euryale.AAC.5
MAEGGSWHFPPVPPTTHARPRPTSGQRNVIVLLCRSLVWLCRWGEDWAVLARVSFHATAWSHTAQHGHTRLSMVTHAEILLDL